MPNIKNFNWRDYITLDDSVSAEGRKNIEGVIDLIFIDRDGDGRIDNKASRKLARKIVNSDTYSSTKKLSITGDRDVGSH